jgi:site-specific DNA recombinase
MKKAVIMCRVSSDEQAKGYSLDVQLEQLTRYCNRNNISIVKQYREDHSAKNFNRPEFQKFLQFVKKNKEEVDLLLITSWDRFSRNLTDSLVMLRTLEKYGVKVQAVEQPIDMSIPENKAMLAIFLAIPEIDNDRRSIKIRGGIRGSLKAGRWCRIAPIGYKNLRDQNNKPIIVPSTIAHHIKYIFEQIAIGKLQSELRTEIYKKGIKISRSNFSKLLRNPIYMGKIIVPKSEEEPMMIIDGIHEGIISENLYFQVQQVLSNNNKIRKLPVYKSLREELPLRGMLSCSQCGEKLTGSRSKSATGNHYFYYHCNYCAKERYPMDLVNQTFESILADFTFTYEAKEIYQLMVKDLLSVDAKDSKVKHTQLDKTLNDVLARIEKLQDLFIDGKIEHNHYSDTMARYTEQKFSLTDEINQIKKMDSDYLNWLKNGVDALSNLKIHYANSAIRDKQQLISSIFPEKFEFDGKKCRTTRINDVLRYMLLIDSDLQNKKSGQLSKKIELSTLVESERIELSSKQATKELSTRLSSDLVFDKKQGQRQPLPA